LSKLKIIIVSGYFNPIHKGHIEYFNNAKERADKLFVIVNNDKQRELKGSKEFQDENERLFIVSNIKAVNKVILSIDNDRSVCKTIESIANEFGENFNLGFANGGDQNNEVCPERDVCNIHGIQLIDGLGKKIQSSSWLLKK
jgi:D-beta-D-heptose 7-phosphate kinase/D-beta-D-heptose 1-phosphate adenosyltransferase